MRAISFFSGAMGLDIGLEKAGIEVILASEIDKSARATIAANKPNLPLIGDLMDYSAQEILKAAKCKKTDVDLMVGGPPCQAFSTAGKRKGFNDARGNVFLKYLDVVTEIMPKFVVIENVRGLLSASCGQNDGDGKGSALTQILNILKSAGYSVSFNLYNTANFGTPQIRERVVIVCALADTPPFLTPTHHENGGFGLKQWKTFKDAVEGLPEHKKTYITFPEKRLKYYRHLGPGQNWRDLPLELQKEALGKAFFSGGGKTGFFRRLAWDKPSPTLVTHPAMPATDLAHPVEDRPLSVEEYKRIQEFPDSWILCGSVLDQYKQIGNAVPCGLGYAIGNLVMRLMDGKELKAIQGFQFSRYNNTDHKTWNNKKQNKQLEMCF